MCLPNIMEIYQNEALKYIIITNVNLMLALNERSGDYQNQMDYSPGNHEKQYRLMMKM